MIGCQPKICEEQRFATWFRAFSIGLDGYEHCVDLREGRWIVRLQNPPLLILIILIEDPKIDIVLLIDPFTSPRLEGARELDA